MGEHAGSAYYVMELLAGETLEARHRRCTFRGRDLDGSRCGRDTEEGSVGEDDGLADMFDGDERGPVDDTILDLRKELMLLSAQNAQLAQELKEAVKARDESQAALSEAADPTYSGVGARAALILSTAEDQAAHLLAEAEREAERKRKSVALEVEAQRGEAVRVARQHRHAIARFYTLTQQARCQARDQGIEFSVGPRRGATDNAQLLRQTQRRSSERIGNGLAPDCR